MSPWGILVGALGTAFLAILGWVLFGSASYIRRRKLTRFAGRGHLDDDQFYERFYKSSDLDKNLVVSLRHELGNILEIPAVLLLPTDRFDAELAVAEGWSYLDDSADELFLVYREREKRLGVRIPIASIHTVDEYIRTLGHLESPSNRQTSG